MKMYAYYYEDPREGRAGYTYTVYAASREEADGRTEEVFGKVPRFIARSTW